MVSAGVSLAQQIRAAGFPATAVATRKQVERVLGRISKVDHVLVRDVGQANFVSLVGRTGELVLHFDAGWPISFNGRTAPKNPTIPLDRVPIILSHWDFDHLLAFYRFPHTRDSIWIAPIQNLGPGQLCVANILARSKRLLGWSRGTISVSLGRLEVCSGSGSNDSGLAVIVSLRSGKWALLVGDAAYVVVHPRLLALRFDALVVTHHGALFAGAVPRPRTKSAESVISVGTETSDIPVPKLIKDHKQGGWRIFSTAELSVGGARRSTVGRLGVRSRSDKLTHARRRFIVSEGSCNSSSEARRLSQPRGERTELLPLWRRFLAPPPGTSQN